MLKDQGPPVHQALSLQPERLLCPLGVKYIHGDTTRAHQLPFGLRLLEAVLRDHCPAPLATQLWYPVRVGSVMWETVLQVNDLDPALLPSGQVRHRVRKLRRQVVVEAEFHAALRSLLSNFTAAVTSWGLTS